jgi:predicted ATP-grasp superfamily ATP-dependent carboligase
VQSLGRLGHDVYVFGEPIDHPILSSRYCRGLVASRGATTPDAFAKDLLRVLEDGRYDLLIPISDIEIDAVSSRLDDIRRHTKVAISEPAQIDIAKDKSRTTKLAIEAGIATPRSYFPRDIAEVEALSASIPYPCVAKIPVSTASLGVSIIADAESLVQFFRDRGKSDNWPFIQEFITGDLYDVTAVCNEGEVVAYFAFRSPIDSQVGGTPPYAYTVNDPELIKTTQKVLRALKWHGAVDLDLLKSADGQYTLLEVNPRFSGTVNFAYKMGVDLPRAYYDLVYGQLKPDYQTSYPEDVLFRTLVPAEVDYLNRQGLRAIKQIIAKSFRRGSVSNIYWDDKPLLRRKARQAAGMIRNRLFG